MIEDLTKKELRAQLKANGISFPIKATEEDLRTLLATAIEEGKAALNFDASKGEEDDAEGKMGDSEEGAGDSNAYDSLESSEASAVVSDIKEERQASVMEGLRQMSGLHYKGDVSE